MTASHRQTPATTSKTARDMRVIVAEDLDSLAPYVAAWDALAVERGRPFCAPAWMLSWWRHARTGDARLRVVLAIDDGEVAGVGPFFAQVGPLSLTEMRLLGAGFSHRIGPLARTGSEESVAVALAKALAGLQPRPASVVFEGIDREDPWPDLIAAAWPSRRPPRLRTDATMDAPIIELRGAYDEWLERRERHFRKESRRTARRMEEEGVRCRVAADERAVEELLRLHHARWENRGGSNVGDQARLVITDAAEELRSDDRLAVALLEAPEGAVAAELLLCAGDTAAFWGGGFDSAWARNAPGTQAMLLALRVLAAHGTQIADLGGGAHAYKRRLADSSRPLVWQTVFPRGSRYLMIRMRLAPKHTFHALRRLTNRLPVNARRRLKHILRLS